MPNFDSSLPFDDELLSGYLDGELSPSERAEVEARLARDPAARQLLSELEAVSAAVRELPPTELGDDLRPAILRQAESTMLRDAQSDGQSSTRPGATIGRSRRGWVWAGLAVAAALTVMVLQPGNDPERGERELAHRDDQAGDQPAPDVALDSDDAERERELAASSAVEESTLEESVAERSVSEVAPDVVAGTAIEPESGELGLGRPASSASRASAASSELLVVHVSLTPAAWQRQEFDGLLIRNGIDVETTDRSSRRPPPRAATSRSSELRSAPSAAPESPTVEHAEEAEESLLELQEESPLDVLLVEAPASQIAEFLSGLQSDEENFRAVVIDEASVGDEPAEQLDRQPKDRASTWQQYSRGSVPARQRRVVTILNEQIASSGQSAAGGVGGIGQADQLRSPSARQLKSAEGRGRALRVQQLEQSDDGPNIYFGRAPSQAERHDVSNYSLDVRALEQAQAELSRSPSSTGADMQVLFVLSPQLNGATAGPDKGKTGREFPRGHK